MVVFKIISEIFPVTDFNHPIISSSLLMMCESIIYCKVINICDINTILFTMSLLLCFIKETHRVIPEFFNLLQSLVFLCFNKKQLSDNRFNKFSWINYDSDIEDGENIDSYQIPLSYLDNVNIEESKNTRNMIYNTLLNIINESIDIYKDIPNFMEYYTSIIESLYNINDKKINNDLKKYKNNIINKLYYYLEISLKNRQPVNLQKEAQKAQSIRTFVFINLL